MLPVDACQHTGTCFDARPFSNGPVTTKLTWFACNLVVNIPVPRHAHCWHVSRPCSRAQDRIHCLWYIMGRNTVRTFTHTLVTDEKLLASALSPHMSGAHQCVQKIACPGAKREHGHAEISRNFSTALKRRSQDRLLRQKIERFFWRDSSGEELLLFSGKKFALF